MNEQDASKGRERVVRSALEDIRKNINQEIGLCYDEQVDQNKMVERDLGNQIKGLKIALSLIEKYEREVIDLIYPKK